MSATSTAKPWKSWWESNITWSVSVFNGEGAHCPYILTQKEARKPTSPHSRPAIRGTLVHDFLELVVKRMATEAVALDDYTALGKIFIEAADKKNVGNDVFDEAWDMAIDAIENGIFNDLNFEDSLGIETGIALQIFEDDETGGRELEVIDWDPGWEYDATKEEKSRAAPLPFFRGKLDRFALRDEGDGLVAYILDYKTTLAMEDEDAFKRLPNGKMYSWLLDKYLREKHDIHVKTFVYRHAFIRYYNAKKGMIIQAEELEEVQDKILQRIENRINRMCLARVRGPFCKYCIEQDTCDEGEDLDINSLSKANISHQLVKLQNQMIYGKNKQSQAEKEIKKLVDLAGGSVLTEDFEFYVTAKPDFDYDFSSVATLTELGKELIKQGTSKGKVINDINDIVQIRSSSCNEVNMPQVMKYVASPKFYKRATVTAKKGDKKVKKHLKAVRMKKFI